MRVSDSLLIEQRPLDLITVLVTNFDVDLVRGYTLQGINLIDIISFDVKEQLGEAK